MLDSCLLNWIRVCFKKNKYNRLFSHNFEGLLASFINQKVFLFYSFSYFRFNPINIVLYFGVDSWESREAAFLQTDANHTGSNPRCLRSVVEHKRAATVAHTCVLTSCTARTYLTVTQFNVQRTIHIGAGVNFDDGQLNFQFDWAQNDAVCRLNWNVSNRQHYRHENIKYCWFNLHISVRPHPQTVCL